MNIKILGRPSSQTLSVYWADPQKCRYEDQLWRLMTAKDAGSCALTHLPIRSGELIYVPRKSNGHAPANRDAMIAATSVLAYDIDDDKPKSPD